MSIGAVSARPFDRPVTSRSHASVRHVAAFAVVGGAVALLELPILGLDHGTHLLAALTVVVGVALRLGAGPAMTGFAAGGALALAASMVTIEGVLGTPHLYVQLLMYLLAGIALIVLASSAIRSRTGSPITNASPVATSPGHPTLAEPLTARETEVLRLAATGIPVDEIARRLYVSPNTAKTHLTHAYAKLGVHGRSDAIRAALHCGCLTPTDICPHLAVDESENHPFG